MGDWLIDPQGGEREDVTVDGLDVGMEVTVEE